MHLATPRCTGDHPAAAPGSPVRLPPRGGRARPAGWPTRRRATSRLDDGRTLRAYDAGADADDAFTIVWHHGSPQTGAPLDPLLAAAARARDPAALLRPPELRRVDRAPRPRRRVGGGRRGRDRRRARGRAVRRDGRLRRRPARARVRRAPRRPRHRRGRDRGHRPVHRGLRLVRRHARPRRPARRPRRPRRAGAVRRDRRVRPGELHRRRLGGAVGDLAVARQRRDGGGRGRARRPDRRRRRVRVAVGVRARAGRGPGPARAGRGGPRRPAGARRLAGAPRARAPSCGCARATATSRSSTPSPVAMDWLRAHRDDARG